MAITLQDQIEDRLRGVQDPETGRDLIAMGMIYDIRVLGDRAEIDMTTTTRGCPMADMLRLGVEAAVLGVEGIRSAEVRLVWEPPWTPARMAPG
ncbi:metal-sulfur cluster assembly factor [Fuscibacter oryzae]|uniref:Metal-sulfur cluster assembly factor n=1 Tax=Fuscibacter oryzae TaxID=2803939 RepID=A0A8J7MR90_9RHOB|nr:metal-sulfur cluster assembly factor [Fuscibacter oryzae]MBL4928758.1 metal-sulfur cluster assembly factor [Fuscibacter oryzae]